MAWQKPPASLLATFEQLLPDDPRVERRRMFGLPCAFVNGNMFVGVHEASIVMRLSQADRAAAKNALGAKDFVPMGRPMREYVAVAEPVAGQRDEVRRWIGRSLDYAAALPAKAPKARKPTRKMAAKTKP